MGKCFTQRSFNCRSVQAFGTFSFELLLQADHVKRLRSYAHAESRRDLYKMAILWLSEDSTGANEGRARNQSQTDSRNYAKTRTGWESTRPQYFKGPPGASQIPISFTRHQNSRSARSMELRHHIHPTEK
jgi:hypothetical protein